MTKQVKTAARVGPEAIAEVARAGVERALAARRSAVELDAEQVEQVSGGALSLKLAAPIIAGGIWGPIDVITGKFGPQTGPATLGEFGVPTTGV